MKLAVEKLPIDTELVAEIEKLVERGSVAEPARHEVKAPDQADTQLSSVEVERLGELENVITHGVKTVREVGLAFLEIQEKRLYRQAFCSFRKYCQRKWGFGPAKAYRLIEAAKVVEAMSPIGDTPLPTKESAIRPLTILKSPEDRAAAMKIVAAKVGKKAPTAREVKAAVEKVKAAKPVVDGHTSEAVEMPASDHGAGRQGKVVPLPVHYPSKTFPSFEVMLGWAQTIKDGLDVEAAEPAVIKAIEQLESALLNYKGWAAQAAAA